MNGSLPPAPFELRMNVPFVSTRQEKKKPLQEMPVKFARQPPLLSMLPVSQLPAVAFDAIVSSSEPFLTMFGPNCSKTSWNCSSTKIVSTGPPWLELAATITGIPVSVASVVSPPWSSK